MNEDIGSDSSTGTAESHAQLGTVAQDGLLKVGDTIYCYDENNRVYRRDETGRAHGGPIFEEYFVPHVIKGETKQSWLTGHDGDWRVNKATMRSAGKSGFGGHQWFTDASMADEIWRKEHRYAIVRLVESADAATLRKVAATLNYSPLSLQPQSPTAHGDLIGGAEEVKP